MGSNDFQEKLKRAHGITAPDVSGLSKRDAEIFKKATAHGDTPDPLVPEYQRHPVVRGLKDVLAGRARNQEAQLYALFEGVGRGSPIHIIHIIRHLPFESAKKWAAAIKGFRDAKRQTAHMRVFDGAAQSSEKVRKKLAEKIHLTLCEGQVFEPEKL
ncbi:MAG: hypothetical protein Q8P02_04100, partial [Candidatus Micrarchaeota archaeon]|nr:hypothetical protein [Candidatus Micrarchaeota archaeon]